MCFCRVNCSPGRHTSHKSPVWQQESKSNYLSRKVYFMKKKEPRLLDATQVAEVINMAFTRLLLQTSCYIVINDIITISSALCFEDISLHFLNYYIFCSSVVLIWCLRSFSVIIPGFRVYPRGAEDIWSHIFFQQHQFQFLSTANSCVAFLRRFRHYSL